MNSLDGLLDRPKLYYNIDGVGELGIGLSCLGFGLLGWMQMRTPQSAIWHRMDFFLIYVGLMVAIIHFGSKAIKEHITYPRTGRVEYPRRDRVWKPMIWGAAVSIAVSVAIVVGMRTHWDLARMSPLVGLVFAGTYARGIAPGAPWKQVVAWAIAVCSIGLALFPVDLSGGLQREYRILGGMWLVTLLYGAMLLISGGISFWVYLRETR